MSITLESLQEMWVKDAEIDRDNLHDESLNIPSLHAKYFELYNTVFLLRKKAEQQRNPIPTGLGFVCLVVNALLPESIPFKT